MDEQENVDAGSENSGEPADTVQTDVAADTTDTVQTDTVAENAGDTAGPKAGDTCTCPDGRVGTLHSFDEGLICLPNQG